MKKIIIMITALILLQGYYSYSQPGKFQAVFIFNFYKQMEWPPSYSNSDFIIGVIGDSPAIPLLEKITESNTGKNKFVIIKFNTVEQITKCNMLYLPEEKSHLFDAVLKKLQGTSTLLITEKAGLGGKGAAINFVEINNRLRFELNEAVIRKAQIQITDMLKNLAILI